jgi:glutamyl-tRNA reductase
MKIFVAGLSYRTAPVELREKLSVHASRLSCSGCRLKLGGNLSEVVLISTCNRVEIYGVTSGFSRDIEDLFHYLSNATVDVSPYIYIKEGAEAVRHLFTVASGLDSMVIGETEITGQVKHAYETAQKAKLTGSVLNRVFQAAFQTAKLVRTQTGIGRGPTSVGSVAVELAEKIFDQDLSQKTVMIIGAGKMGESCVRHLSKKGARSVLVSNRSYERAQALAQEFGGSAIRFDECLKAMKEADIVVSSTGCPHTILDRDAMAQVMPARRNRPLVLIDIAVPRDIATDVRQLENVYLYDVDDLEVIVRENVKHRESELAHCRTIVNDRTAAVMTRLTPASTEVGTEIQLPVGWSFRRPVSRASAFLSGATTA